MIHATPHPLAGQTVLIGPNVADPIQHAVVPGAEYRVEDWWDRVAGMSWMVCDGNPAAMHYGFRSGLNGLPTDDEVVYGKIGSLGHLVHVSELVGTTQVTSPAVEGDDAGASNALRAPRPAARSGGQSGGVVPGPPGAELPAILQAGERVIPAGTDGGVECRYVGYSGQHGWCSTHHRWENMPANHNGAGPADDDLVWIAIRRKGIDAHRPDRIDDNGVGYTGCDRSMRCGEQLLAAEARAAYQAHWCHRCWPDQPGGVR